MIDHSALDALLYRARPAKPTIPPDPAAPAARLFRMVRPGGEADIDGDDEQALRAVGFEILPSPKRGVIRVRRPMKAAP